ncbi:uncharacterized protein LOC122651022 [Telopea speciosissima]|uniref:uncharacterized protein LOC122651022 n=1 Tax=Telopea speciosissima TaxID=54955 RepID=UPI001CC52389|nr:uncharacterized protein LOC122651022 [Telopea speciosissima]
MATPLPPSTPIVSTWTAPPLGSFKLNCDVSWNPRNNRSGLGFLIQNHLSETQVAISIPSMFNDILVGEEMAIRDGLLEALSEGSYTLVVGTDNQDDIFYLRDFTKIPTLSIRSIVIDIKHLITYFDHVSFQYIPREANVVVDSLARRALSLTYGIVCPIPIPVFLLLQSHIPGV